MAEITGTSFTALTVKVNGLVAVNNESVTVMTRFEVPNSLSAGFIVTVQFGAVPPNVILATGSNVVLEDVTLKFADVQRSVLSTSVMVNEIAPVTVSSFVV